MNDVSKDDRDETMAFVIKTARTYDPDPAHSENVANLALALFDGLRTLHRYGSGQRRLLEIAGRLHDLGWAHSVEVWEGARLAGGLYGIALGGLFAGESMFHEVGGASKVAFAACADRLRERGFSIFDVQVLTPHLRLMGCVEIPRDEYRQRVRAALQVPARFA